MLLRGDLAQPEHCRAVAAHTVEALGGRDVPANNVAYQQPNDDFTAISDEQWRRTFAVNIDSFFHVAKAALAHLVDGAAIINTSSINGRPARQKHPDGLRSDQVRVPRPRADSLNASTQTSSEVLAEAFGFVSVRPNRPGWPR